MKKHEKLAGDAVVVRNGGLLTTEVDGELMAMTVDRGICYALDGVGTRIWALIAEPRSVDDICEALVGEFDVEAAVCRKDVVELLQGLRSEGLVTIRAA